MNTFLSSLRSLEALWGLLGGSFGRLLGSLELFRGSFRGLGGHSGALWATLGAPGEVLWFSSSLRTFLYKKKRGVWGEGGRIELHRGLADDGKRFDALDVVS